MRRAVILEITLGVLLMPSLTFGQRAAWEQLTASGNEFRAQGRYAEAETAFRGALEKAEGLGEPRVVARSLNDLAVALESRGDYAQAEQFYHRAVAAWGHTLSH